MTQHDDDRFKPLLPLDDAAETRDFEMIDTILRGVNAMRLQTAARRRIHRRRVALAATLLLTSAGAGAYGYLTMTITKPAQTDSPSPTVVAAVPEGRDAKPAPAGDRLRGPGKLDPLTLATRSLIVNNRPIPMFGPLDDEAGDPSRPTYVYLAPSRLVGVRYNRDAGQAALTIDWTAPRPVVEEEAARLGGPGKGAEANLQPLPMHSYTIELSGGDGPPVIARSGSGDALISPSSGSLVYVPIPESAPLLRDKLAKGLFKDVSLRVTASYDFTRVARGVVSLSRVGAAVLKVFEEVTPSGRRPDGPTMMVVDRTAIGKIVSRIHDGIKRTARNSGLSDQAWADLLAQADRSLTFSFDKIPVDNLADLLAREKDVSLIYTVKAGQLEARPLLINDKVTLKAREEEYFRKGEELLNAVQDVFKKGSYSRASHHDLKERFHGEGEVHVNVMSFFGGGTKLGFQKETSEVNDEDLRRANESRDYYLNDSARRDELRAIVKERIEGDLRKEVAEAKSLQVFRIDENELVRAARSALEHIEDLGVEPLAFASEGTLQVEPSDELAALRKMIIALEAKGQSQEAEFKAVRDQLALADRTFREQAAKIDELQASLKKSVQAPPSTVIATQLVVLQRDRPDDQNALYIPTDRETEYIVYFDYKYNPKNVTRVEVIYPDPGAKQHVEMARWTFEGGRLRVYFKARNPGPFRYAAYVIATCQD